MPDTSSLRTAIDKIMGWPAAGPSTPSTGGVAPRGDVVNLGTTSLLENEVPPPAPDPFADELAALQASNAELAAQLGGGTAAAAAVDEPRNSAGLTQQEFTDAITRTSAATPGIIEPDKFIAGSIAGQFSTPENWTNYYSLTGLTGTELENQAAQAASTYAGGAHMQQSSGAYDPYKLTIIPGTNPAPASTTTPKATTLRNPGPKAPWQESQQYWKDLAAQTKK